MTNQCTLSLVLYFTFDIFKRFEPPPGYDRELVDVLHREIIQLRPNVKWQDVAGNT